MTEYKWAENPLFIALYELMEKVQLQEEQIKDLEMAVTLETSILYEEVK